MSTQQIQSFNPFFGGDVKGNQFVRDLYDDENYAESGKQQWDPAKPIAKLLQAGFRNGPPAKTSNGIEQKPDDVPQDVVDLIINTAIFHRKIDEPTGYKKKIEDAYVVMKSKLLEYMLSRYKTPVELDTAVTAKNKNNSDNTDGTALVTPAPLKYMCTTPMQYIIAILFDYALRSYINAETLAELKGRDGDGTDVEINYDAKNLKISTDTAKHGTHTMVIKYVAPKKKIKKSTNVPESTKTKSTSTDEGKEEKKKPPPPRGWWLR